MIEYVSKTDAMVMCAGHDGLAYAIFKMKPADVAPVVHGKWIDEDPAFAEYFANCSVCGYEIDVHNERGYFNFCPNCGAKMDKE
jgi:hypothetical protein